MSNEIMIRMEQIVKTYYIGQPNELEILHEINLDVKRGEFVSIVGESGSGKSTLMNIMGILDRQTSGNYFLEGEDVNSMDDTVRSVMRNKKIGFVFQNFNLIPRANALKNVTLPLMYSEHHPKNAKEIGMQMLELVGMADRATHRPNELSGGQKRRVAIAGVLAMDPEVLILDEPTAGLDPRGRDEVLDQVSALQRSRGITVILVSHSMEDVAKYVDRLIVMNQGEVRFDGRPVEVFHHYKELEEIGLAAPQTTYLMQELKKQGADVNTDATTVEEAADAIEAWLKASK